MIFLWNSSQIFLWQLFICNDLIIFLFSMGQVKRLIFMLNVKIYKDWFRSYAAYLSVCFPQDIFSYYAMLQCCVRCDRALPNFCGMQYNRMAIIDVGVSLVLNESVWFGAVLPSLICMYIFVTVNIDRRMKSVDLDCSANILQCTNVFF